MAETAEIDGALSTDRHRWQAGIVGGRIGPDGKLTATRSYALGCAPDPEGGCLVTLIEEIPGIAITFEADDFDQAFARALVIAEDMADAAGHLADGVVVSLVECDSLADLGVDWSLADLGEVGPYTRQIRRLLRAAGYEFEREGKGDHEIWRNAENGKRVTIDVNCRNRHTANKILRDADLPKAF